MPEPTTPMDDFLRTMLEGQSQMLKAQSAFWQQASTAGAATDDGSFGAASKQIEDWLRKMQAKGWPAGDDIAAETLRSVMDPTRLAFGGTDALNQAIQKLVEGPEFADIGTLERQGLQSMKEWFALKEASAAYRAVTGRAWARAFERFSGEVAGEPDIWTRGTRAFISRWLAVANDELIAMQRTDEFLQAHRDLLRSGVAYRLRERELVEAWCESRSMPTRTEVDDLHKMTYQLRKELRRLRKELDELRAQSGRGASTAIEGKTHAE